MTPTPAPADTERRPYTPPALAELGTIHDVTATNCDHGGSDSGTIQNPGENIPCY